MISWIIWTSRVNLTELPTFEEFRTFLTARIHALEIAGDTSPGSQKTSSSPTSKVVKVHQSSSTGSAHSKPPDLSKVTHSIRIAQHPCTYCGEPQFVVACPSFKWPNESQRRKFFMEKLLCFNCLSLIHSKLGQRRNHPCSRWNSFEKLIYSINFIGNCIGMVRLIGDISSTQNIH